MNVKKIGRKIKQARVEAGLSQAALGEKIGVTWEMISRYENGRSSPHKYLEEMSEILHKPLVYFVDDETYFRQSELGDKVNDVMMGYSSGVSYMAPLFDTYEEFQQEGAQSTRSLRYVVPAWVAQKFRKVFVFRTNDIDVSEIGLSASDVLIATADFEDNDGKYCLYYEKTKRKMYVSKENKSGTCLGKLIYAEKRFNS